MMRAIIVSLLVCCAAVGTAGAQEKAIINNSASGHARLHSVNLEDVTLTDGFWKEKFDLVAEKTLPAIWTFMASDSGNHWHNLQVAAGVIPGQWRRGTSWHDGDLYKWVEAASQVWLVTKDPALDRQMDKIIAVIAKAQQPDGYIATQNQLSIGKRWQNIHHHELYDMGHLLTAACMHYRATGKRTLLDAAVKCGDYLYDRFVTRGDDPKMWVFGFDPSQIMGLVELYRTTGNRHYLDTANRFIDNRGKTKVGKTVTREFADQNNSLIGTDLNQDHVPLREETQAVGHAVTATYLYCGAADAVMETGDESLMAALERIWGDIVHRKMYIHGGVGPLTNGLSIRNDPVHEAFGDPYYLHNRISYCETCANNGNAMFNWRMLNITGDARCADVMERVFYNAGISGLGLDGGTFFYTNVLRRYGPEVPILRNDTGVRWFARGGRGYCCPPQLARVIAEMRGYFYSTSPEGLWIHMFAANTLNTTLQDGTGLRLVEQTAYPWEGRVTMTVNPARTAEFALMVRIPGWADGALLAVNGAAVTATPGTYATIRRTWKSGDTVTLDLPMTPRLMEANPLVEESRNEVAVFRGPVLYCLESVDLPAGVKIEDVMLPEDITWSVDKGPAALDRAPVLHGQAWSLTRPEWADTPWDSDTLYRTVVPRKPEPLALTLIPYHTWSNRGRSEMTVFLPVDW